MPGVSFQASVVISPFCFEGWVYRPICQSSVRHPAEQYPCKAEYALSGESLTCCLSWQ